jgi:hypothetical protein
MDASGAGGGLLRLRKNAYNTSRLADLLECHGSFHFGKQGIIPADPDILARAKLRAPLPHEDVAGQNLSPRTVSRQPLRVAVTAIAGASNAFFVCHTCL